MKSYEKVQKTLCSNLKGEIARKQHLASVQMHAAVDIVEFRMNFPLWMSLGSWNAINSLKSTPPINDLPDDDTFCMHTSTRYIVYDKLLSEWDFTSTALCRSSSFLHNDVLCHCERGENC